MMRARRGSALILVLLMTLAVAALAVAAIFMSSSAGLLSRFYDKERLFRLAAESALDLASDRMMRDTMLVIPDTGFRSLVSGYQLRDANNAVIPGVTVNVFGSVTGDTTGRQLPFVSLIAQAYDASGVRLVLRMDLRRESFSRYAIFADRFSASFAFGPGTVHGPVHTNETWRNLNTPVFADSVTARVGFSGTATYRTDTATVSRIQYPADSVYATTIARGDSANLAITSVAAPNGTRIEFVSVDANANGTVEEGEGFLKVFDLAIGDTARLSAQVSDYFAWNSPIIQNQCGVAYWIPSPVSRWEFIPVSTHRAQWALDRIALSGVYPATTNGTRNSMRRYRAQSVQDILTLPTARCYPAGSPFLMPAERFTTTGFALAGTPADSLEWGRSASHRYGGMDTTFTPRVQTCLFVPADPNSSPPISPTCSAGTRLVLGTWRTFPGTAATVSASVRQANEVPRLWPTQASANPKSRGVVRVTGHSFVSGTVAGNVTLFSSSRVVIVDALRYSVDPNDPSIEACRDQLGVVAVADVLVANSPITRNRYAAHGSNTTYHLGSEKQVTIQGNLMSLQGSVGVADNGEPIGPFLSYRGMPCPMTAASEIARSPGGCLAITGAMVMRDFRPLHVEVAFITRMGYRYAGIPDRCQSASRRPPFFPLTKRYTLIRTVEISPSRAASPAQVRALLMALKGRAL